MSSGTDRSTASAGGGRQPGFLAPGEHVESKDPAVVAFARESAANAADEREAAVRLYYAVRDGIRYDPYTAGSSPDALRASTTLRARRGWCVGKAVLLAACCRSIGIAARLGFSDVRNHLSTARMRQFMGTDVFYYHGYTQLRIEGRWVKATPAFNIELCEKMQLLPLDFDGRNDSLYHPLDREGKRHMEYLWDHGVFDAVPVEAMVVTWRRHYPQAGPDRSGVGSADAADFESEVEAEFGKG
jgi:transglutaminase-like putative cysteine protease